MTSKRTIDIHVNGYVCEIVCGQIPARAREAVLRHLLETRNESGISEWLKRRYPDHVSPEAANALWYAGDDLMADIMGSCGLSWPGYRGIDGFCRMRGFGSGKGDMGLFDIQIDEEGERIAGFVPFDPRAAVGRNLMPIGDLKTRRRRGPSLPLVADTHVAVSAGSWAKGTMVFTARSDRGFDDGALEIVLTDLTRIGVGEDHFVTGLRYEGSDLPGVVTREAEKEMYPVSWYSAKKGRWRLLSEPE